MNNIKLIAWQFWRRTIYGKVIIPIYTIWLLLVVYAVYTGHETYSKQNELASTYQHKARKSWEANPDKHPHRMAHFGSFAFRVKHPLSIFDNGMESFTGNVVYLEAHKQNTVNFSEASFSTGLLRFGEVSLSMLLQLILPLILFFLGFNALAQQKENGTLKILLSQGASFRQMIIGNSIGLVCVAILFSLPVAVSSILFSSIQNSITSDAGLLVRGSVIMISCTVFLWIVSVLAIAVSATSDNSRSALLKLLGMWLLLSIVLPKTLQAIGSYLYPAPGKIEFETAIETDLLKHGDSHNPNDMHFKALKDSILAVNKVDSVQQLSFNYSGFQMLVGEKMSTQIYKKHLDGLYDIYDKQNSLSYTAAFINPVISFKNISMAFSGTDFTAYRHFQNQAEAYRYNLAQTMNELQMKYISNKKQSSSDKPYFIERSYWTAFPDFRYHYQTTKAVIQQQLVALMAMGLWFLFSFGIIQYSSHKAKAI